MLYVQEIALQYTKAVRYGNYANARRAIRFFPVEFEKSDISDEILFNRVSLYQSRYERRKFSSARSPILFSVI